MQLITGSCGGERCINMAVTLREIIKQVQHLEMKLVAGETGLDHEVSWTHMVDSDTMSGPGRTVCFGTDEKRVFYRQCIYGCECVCSGRQ